MIGEYEVTLKELVETLSKDGVNRLKEIDGLAFRANDTVTVNRRKLLENLDYLPFPDRDDFPVDKYHDFEVVGSSCPQMWTS
ncbi:hypothetical protein [Candidatus Hecatella orcuttiae]|uniref:hypothetical protein n=1 Tax=Candidatus Hecatella orcuttiae TaxID=1935119 RepID=UPI002867D35E|nr:hypothetical protein [Candidatus Hecatella orcuttiae]